MSKLNYPDSIAFVQRGREIFQVTREGETLHFGWSGRGKSGAVRENRYVRCGSDKSSFELFHDVFRYGTLW